MVSVPKNDETGLCVKKSCRISEDLCQFHAWQSAKLESGAQYFLDPKVLRQDYGETKQIALFLNLVFEELSILSITPEILCILFIF